MKKASIIATMAFGMIMVFTSNSNAQKFPALDKSPMDIASYPNDYKDAKKTARII